MEGEALFDVGHVSDSMDRLKQALDLSRTAHDSLHFEVAFCLFLRSTDFYGPVEMVPQVAELRQLAARIGDAYALSLLHLAVASSRGSEATS